MKRSSVKELLNSDKFLQEVQVKGWVRTFRSNRFIAINDGSTIKNIQCVVDFENTNEELLKRITTSAAVSIKGTLVESQGKGQTTEIQVSELEVLGDSNPDEYPIQPKKHSFEFLRENAHLRVRTNTFSAVMRVRSALSFAVHQYFQQNGFYYVNTPIITGSDAEGAGEMFKVTNFEINKAPKKNLFEIRLDNFQEIVTEYYKEVNEKISFKINSSFYVKNEKYSLEDIITSSPKKIKKIEKEINKQNPNTISEDVYSLLVKKYKVPVKEICKQNNWNLRTNRINRNQIKLTDLAFFKMFNIHSKKTVDYSQDFFGKETNLTVSGQLEAETYAMALGKVYTFGPTFRAENSNTTRHLAEFWMIEPEVAFNDLDANMDLSEDFIKYVLQYVLDNCQDDLAFLDNRLAQEEKQKPQAERSDLGLIERLKFVVENNFKRVSYTEAIDILKNSKPNKKKKFQFSIDEWGADLQSEHERYLVEKHFKCPVILFDYPASIKAFYMRLNEDGKTVRAMDVLFPGIGEMVGGSQREERLDVLKEKMNALDIDEKELWWYLDTRKFGTAVHSGFGLGFERLVLFTTGMGNIRDVIPFPRTPQNAEF